MGDWFNALPEWGLALAAVLLLIGAAEGGVIIARRHKPSPEGADRFLFTLAAPTIGLLGMMIGFTFLMVLTHYQTRVAEVMEAANTIEKAALRARILPEPYRSAVTPLLKEYATLRVAHRGAEVASSAMIENNRRAISYFGSKGDVRSECGSVSLRYRRQVIVTAVAISPRATRKRSCNSVSGGSPSLRTPWANRFAANSPPGRSSGARPRSQANGRSVGTTPCKRPPSR